MKGGSCGGDIHIRFKIVKLPAEAEELAMSIEDALTDLVGATVDSMVSVGDDLESLDITVSETLINMLKKRIT